MPENIYGPVGPQQSSFPKVLPPGSNESGLAAAREIRATLLAGTIADASVVIADLQSGRHTLGRDVQGGIRNTEAAIADMTEQILLIHTYVPPAQDIH